jgi:uncharacterized surface protein with fasciclin (FAS1) repeats
MEVRPQTHLDVVAELLRRSKTGDPKMKGRTLTAGLCALTLSVSVAKATDIIDTAAAAGRFNTFLTAVKAADLHDTLKGASPKLIPEDGPAPGFDIA